MSLKIQTILLILASVLAMAFQNCTKSNPIEFSSNANQKADETDSGQSYDGKIFVTFGSACPDFTEIQSRIIVYSSGQAEKNRHNCQEITPVHLSPSDYALDPNDPEKLTLNNEIFVRIPPTSQGITNFKASSDATHFHYSFTYVGSPQQLHIYIDTDNSPSTGYDLGTVGIDYMIENGSVYQYTGKGGLDWTFTKLGSSNMTGVAPNVSWSIPRSIVGSPTNFLSIGHISNLGSFSNKVILK